MNDPREREAKSEAMLDNVPRRADEGPIIHQLGNVVDNMNKAFAALSYLEQRVSPILKHEDPAAEQRDDDIPLMAPMERDLYFVNERAIELIGRIEDLSNRVAL